MKSLYIFDIDGTIADLTHRLHLIDKTKGEPDWDAFYLACGEDAPIYPVIHTLNSLNLSSEIWLFTGRRESLREVTSDWIEFHTDLGSNDYQLDMRPDGDTRPDYEVKQEMLDHTLEMDRERLIAVFDDCQQVVDMWRRNNVKCYQVKKGDY